MFRFLRLLVQLGWPLRLARPFLGKFNPLDPQLRADPYPGYRRIRERDPVYFQPWLRAWFLTGYDDILGVLRDPSFSTNRTQTKEFRRLLPVGSLSPKLLEMMSKNLLMIDPPDHTRLRTLVNKAFTPRMVEKLRPRIEALVDELLDAAADAEEIDFIREFAYPLPVTVIAEILGVPVADRGLIKKWSDDLAALLDPIDAIAKLNSIQSSFDELSEYLGALIEERRRIPQPDLLSALVAVEEAGDRLDMPEMISLAALILGAGHETTTNLLGNSLVALMRNPGECKRLQDEPGLIDSAVEEFLRYDSPVQATDRIATRDCEIGGKAIRKGQFVVLMLGAGNRDPNRFPDPDRLDLGRPDNRHLSFGQGAHFCLGSHLARLETRIALQRFLRRFPNFQGDPNPSSWRASLTLRGPTALPIRV